MNCKESWIFAQHIFYTNLCILPHSGSRHLGEWSIAGTVVRASQVCEFMSEKVGLTIDFLYNKYVLQFPQKPNIYISLYTYVTSVPVRVNKHLQERHALVQTKRVLRC